MTDTNKGVATSTAKKVNYTAEQKAQIVELYTKTGKDSSNDGLAKIGKEVSRTVQSVRQVLIGEGVYVPLKKVSKTNPSKMDKTQIVSKVEKLLKVEPDALESFIKANKQHLNTLLEHLQGEDVEQKP